jgi:hypothetical protein
MTDEIGTRKREKFSSLEVVSVVAITVILVMIAVPFPYANRNQALPALRPASGGGSVAADTWGDDAGPVSQGSTDVVRTLGKREFCADMPGVVRFRTTGASCRNGTTITNAQRHRDQLEKP